MYDWFYFLCYVGQFTCRRWISLFFSHRRVCWPFFEICTCHSLCCVLDEAKIGDNSWFSHSWVTCTVLSQTLSWWYKSVSDSLNYSNYLCVEPQQRADQTNFTTLEMDPACARQPDHSTIIVDGMPRIELKVSYTRAYSAAFYGWGFHWAVETLETTLRQWNWNSSPWCLCFVRISWAINRPEKEQWRDRKDINSASRKHHRVICRKMSDLMRWWPSSVDNSFTTTKKYKHKQLTAIGGVVSLLRGGDEEMMKPWRLSLK